MILNLWIFMFVPYIYTDYPNALFEGLKTVVEDGGCLFLLFFCCCCRRRRRQFFITTTDDITCGVP